MSLPSPYNNNEIEDIVPDYMRVSSKVSAASVIQSRTRVRYVPQTQEFLNPSSASQINWILTDNGFLDLPSATVSFRVETWSATQDASGNEFNVALDDGASVFRRLQVSNNAVLLEDIDQVAKKMNAEVYAQADQSWMNTVGSFLGYWKNTTSNALADGATKYQVQNKVANAAKRTQLFGAAALTPAGSSPAPNPALKNRFTVPLSLLSDMFKEQSLFPIRETGALYIALTLANPVEALVATLPSSPAPATTIAQADVRYRISEITLEIDVLSCHPTFTSVIDAICQNEGEDGLKFPFNTSIMCSQNLPSTSGGSQSVQFAKASQNLKQITIFGTSVDGMQSKAYPAQSTFPNFGVKSIYTRLGGSYYPAQPSLGAARQFADLQSAFSKGPAGSVGTGSVCDLVNYYACSGVVGGLAAISNTAPYQALVGASAATATSLTNAMCDCWMWSYSFDKARLAKVLLDGVNSLTAGSVAVVEMDIDGGAMGQLVNTVGGTPAANGIIVNALIKYSRILECKNKSVRVLG